MSTLSNGTTTYTTVIGSDVTRDGFFAELCRTTAGESVLVAEAFWSDETSDFSITVEVSPLPFSVLEAFLAEARQRLPPSASPHEANHFSSGHPGGA